MESIELHIRPFIEPMYRVEDKDIRIYYRGHWVDFRDGIILVSRDESFQPPADVEIRKR